MEGSLLTVRWEKIKAKIKNKKCTKNKEQKN
jgi:hypothetical protein